MSGKIRRKSVGIQNLSVVFDDGIGNERRYDPRNEDEENDAEVVIDDRDERAGVKFKDADLIGFPYQIIVGKSIAEGNVEFKTRASDEKTAMKPEEAAEMVITAINNIKK